jgi:hypothetical protein
MVMNERLIMAVITDGSIDNGENFRGHGAGPE